MEAATGRRSGQIAHVALVLGEGVIPGLVFAFRFSSDGSAEELPVDKPVDLATDGGHWLWLHVNLADKRACQWIASSADVPQPARVLLVAQHDHQQLYGTGECVYGVFSDLIRDLDRVTDHTGYLNFAMTGHLVVTGRRHPLQSVDAMRVVLSAGRRVANSAGLIELIVEQAATGIDGLLEELAKELDRIEDLLLIDDIGDERRRLGRVRRTGVHLHRQLAGLRSTFNRFGASEEVATRPGLELAIGRLVQRLDALDQEVVALQERARLLQEEIGSKLSEESARHLNALSILTALFLPATLVTGFFGMNTSELPFTHTPIGSFWALGVGVAASAFVYWLLRRMGVINR